VPAIDTGGLQKVLFGVLLRQDAGSGVVNPIVTASVIEVPVGVDQLFYGSCVDGRQGLGNSGARGYDFSVNQQFSVGPSQNGNISTSAQEHTDVAAQRMHRDLYGSGFLKRVFNQVVFLSEAAPWRETSRGKRQTARGEKLAA
jgi:hypothetical protein